VSERWGTDHVPARFPWQAPTPRLPWCDESVDALGHGTWWPVTHSGYIERFRKMAAEGVDLDGEARLLARCSLAGRVCWMRRDGGAELAARGHIVVGVDADRELIEAAKVDHPGPNCLLLTWPNLTWLLRASRNGSTRQCVQVM